MGLFDDEAVKVMEGRLKGFMDTVSKSKLDIYKDLFSKSISILGLALVCLFLALVPYYFIPGAGPVAVVLFVFTAVLAIGGIPAMAIIPEDRFNLDDWEASSPGAYLAIRVALAALETLVGLTYLFLGGNVTPDLHWRGVFTVMILALGLTTAFSVVIDVRAREAEKGMAPSLLFSDFSSATIAFVLLALSSWFFNGAVYSYTIQVDPTKPAGYFHQLDCFMFGAGYLCAFIFVCGRRAYGYTKFDAFKSQVKGWRSRAALDTFLTLLFSVAACYFVEMTALSFAYANKTVCDPECSLLSYLYFFSVLDIVERIAGLFSVWIPLLILIGSLHFESVRKLLFQLLAERWGWEDVTKRQSAGARLAAATNIQVTDTQTGVYWFLRKERDMSYSDTPIGAIRRDYWMPGHIDKGTVRLSDPACRSFSARIYYREDNERGWSARFLGPRVVFSGAPWSSPLAASTSSEFFSFLLNSRPAAGPDEIELAREWRNNNFDTETPVHNDDPRGPYVVQSKEQKARRFTEVADGETDYSTWASMHFRAYPLKSALASPEDLLSISPRDATKQSRRFWNLSQQETVKADAQRIDYFLSHSWDDNGSAAVLDTKISMFRKLVASAPFGKIWFDQACIVKEKCADCKEVNCDLGTMSFATLPISVGNCKKLLVMLSPTYLTRLWCIMELFSVFAFAIPEVAVARIDIVRLLGADAPQENELEAFKMQIAAWTLDQAHCFDPNEEYKIRQVAFAIGETEFLKCVRSLTDCRFVQLDRVPWWRRWLLSLWQQLPPWPSWAQLAQPSTASCMSWWERFSMLLWPSKASRAVSSEPLLKYDQNFSSQ